MRTCIQGQRLYIGCYYNGLGRQWCFGTKCMWMYVKALLPVPERPICTVTSAWSNLATENNHSYLLCMHVCNTSEELQPCYASMQGLLPST